MDKEIGITVKKNENFSEWYTQVCIKSELIDIRYNVQGFIVHRPWATKIIKNIFKIFERELEKTGHQPVIFPTVIPEENFEKEKEHVRGFKPEVFWITEAGEEKLDRRLALRPTSETAFYQMYSLWITSWRDLPLKLYQSVSVYRYEKVTRPFIRGREFLWIEAHNVFETHEEALKQVREDMENSRKVIWEQLGIPFLFFKRPKWDKFAGAVDTYAADTLLPDGRVLQISSTHDLGQNFSKAFEIVFIDREGRRKYAWQTCYGPGIWRIVAAIISIHGDDRGLVLPLNIAPIQIVIIPIIYKDSDKDKVMDKCNKILETLLEKNYRVHIDTRDKTPGWKFNDWELRGVPIRIEIGMKEVEKNIVTIFRRDLRKRMLIEDDKLIETIEFLEKDILNVLKNRAEKFLKENIITARNREEIIEGLNKGKIIRISFCGKEECAMDLKEKTNGGKIRGILLGKPEENFDEKCAWCGGNAVNTVYVAKSY
ncbi:MAG: proline--tRNA ligase [Thermoprotei archaeon]|nr:MAG: proline--tRNA ligase [Thermoprotei archaeon]